MSDDPNITTAIDPVRLSRAMRSLRYREREALLMKTRDKMTYAEIGAALGLTPQEAEAHVASALVQLHARLMRRRRLRWRFAWRIKR
jgi:DNA-directed RNA polymerase specialized sigma24 family protein